MNQRNFSFFRIFLLAIPAIFLLYLLRFWFWFLYPLPTNVLEFTTGVLFIFWIFGLLWFEFPKPNLSKWQWFGVGLFLLAITIATAYAVWKIPLGRSVPLGIWKGWFVAPLLYFFMLVSSFRGKKDLELLIEVTTGIIALSASVMLLQYFTGIFSEIQATIDFRLVWPYLDPLSGKGTSGNYPAIFLSPFLALAWIMTLKSELKLDRLYYFLCALVIAITVYYTKSYGAWLAVIGAMAFGSFFVMSGFKRWVLVPVCTIVLLSGLYVDQKNTEKFRYGLDTQDDTVISSREERSNIWKVSIDLIKANPIFGIGPGQFQRAFERQAPFTLKRPISRQEVDHALHSHNTYLMFWLSNGILGIISFVFLLVVLVVPVPRNWKIVLITPLFYLLAHGLIDVMVFKNDLAFSFWYFASLFVIAGRMNTVTGRVVKGLQLGREMGFPTVNLNLGYEFDRPYGVYVADVFIGKLKKKGLLYYGPRKIAGLPEKIVCEVTILDFEGDLYDQQVKISIGQFIRGPRKFETVLDLKKQIEKDILIARHRRFI